MDEPRTDLRPPGIMGRRCDDELADRTAYGICPYDGSQFRLLTVTNRGAFSMDMYCPACRG